MERRYREHDANPYLVDMPQIVQDFYHSENYVLLQIEGNVQNIPMPYYKIEILEAKKIDIWTLPLSQYAEGFLDGYYSNLIPEFGNEIVKKEKVFQEIRQGLKPFYTSCKFDEETNTHSEVFIESETIYQNGFFEGKRYKAWEIIFETPKEFYDLFETERKKSTSRMVERKYKDIANLLFYPQGNEYVQHTEQTPINFGYIDIKNNESPIKGKAFYFGFIEWMSKKYAATLHPDIFNRVQEYCIGKIAETELSYEEIESIFQTSDSQELTLFENKEIQDKISTHKHSFHFFDKYFSEFDRFVVNEIKLLYKYKKPTFDYMHESKKEGKLLSELQIGFLSEIRNNVLILETTEQIKTYLQQVQSKLNEIVQYISSRPKEDHLQYLGVHDSFAFVQQLVTDLAIQNNIVIEIPNFDFPHSPNLNKKSNNNKDSKEPTKRKHQAPEIRLFCSLMHQSGIIIRYEYESPQQFILRICTQYNLQANPAKARQYYYDEMKIKKSCKYLKKVQEKIFLEIPIDISIKLKKFIDSKINLYA